jgi:DNA polymerase I
MKLLSLDTETYLIQDTDLAPKPVCCTWADETSKWITDPWGLETAATLAQPDLLIVGQNIPYDLLLLMRWKPNLTPSIIRALDEGRVFDTAIRERLMHLKHHGSHGFDMFPSLEKMALKYLKLDLSGEKKGDDIWRLKYGTLDGVPFRDWPQAALDYALNDPRHTYDVFRAQGGINNIQPTEQMQVQAAVALQGIGVWGFAVNKTKRDAIKAALETKTTALHAQIDKYGWTGKGSQERMMKLVSQAWHLKQFVDLRNRSMITNVQIDQALWDQHVPKTTDLRAALLGSVAAGAPLVGLVFPGGVDWKQWSKDTAKILPEIPMTKKGPSFAGEVLEQLGDVVKEFADYTELRHLEKMLENYIEPYKYPTAHARFTPIVSTGRTGCKGSGSSGNQQNIPRKDDDRPDECFRTMFEARPGRVLGTVDYSQLELCTLAATMRTMFPDLPCVQGDAIDAGKDVHCITGSLFTGIPYEQMVAGKKSDKKIKDARQASKAVNFGKPGGLGVAAMVVYARNNYGVDMTFDQMRALDQAWQRAWPDIPGKYLRYSADMVKASPHGTFTAVTITGREKADCIYTEGSNYPFQGLAADGAKAATWAIWREAVLGWYWSQVDGEHYFLHGHVGRPVLAQGYGYAYKDSPLNQSHLVNFVHDEIVAEHPEGDQGKAALARQEQIMVAEMTRICQNKIKISVEGNLSSAWEH